MDWFQGSVSEAIGVAKQGGGLIAFQVVDGGELSSATTAAWSASSVRSCFTNSTFGMFLWSVSPRIVYGHPPLHRAQSTQHFLSLCGGTPFSFIRKSRVSMYIHSLLHILFSISISFSSLLFALSTSPRFVLRQCLWKALYQCCFRAAQKIPQTFQLSVRQLLFHLASSSKYFKLVT